MNAKDTAERIRNLRKAKGMSQSQFAAMCGLVQGQLANYEYGRIMPTIPLCERICETVGIRVIDFLSEDRAPEGDIPTDRSTNGVMTILKSKSEPYPRRAFQKKTSTLMGPKRRFSMVGTLLT